MNKTKIIVTGGAGRFAAVLKKSKTNINYLFPNKKDLNILRTSSIKKYIKDHKAKYLIHNAALSRPMSIHDRNISKSIDINIIGTSNVVKVCNELNVKLIYFSTGYVYEGKTGNYKEEDPVKPFNNYALSKMGGECAVQMYKNSLILRIIMCERPFIHKEAFYDVNTNFIYHDDFIKIFLKLLNKKGIFNIGGKAQTVYQFARVDNKKVKKIFSTGQLPLKMDMDLKKISRYSK